MQIKPIQSVLPSACITNINYQLGYWQTADTNGGSRCLWFHLKYREKYTHKLYVMINIAQKRYSSSTIVLGKNVHTKNPTGTNGQDAEIQHNSRDGIYNLDCPNPIRPRTADLWAPSWRKHIKHTKTSPSLGALALRGAPLWGFGLMARNAEYLSCESQE